MALYCRKASDRRRHGHVVAFFRRTRLVFGGSHPRQIAEVVNEVGLVRIAVLHGKLGPVDFRGVVDCGQNPLKSS